MLAKMLPRQLQEDLAVGAERCPRDVVERGLQLLYGALERHLPLARDLLLGPDLRLEDRELNMQLFSAPLSARPGEKRAQDETDEEACARRNQDRGWC